MKNCIEYTPIYIWGTGAMSKHLIDRYGKVFDLLNVEGFIDNNQKIRGTTYCDRRVYTPEEIRSRKNIWIYIAVVNSVPIEKQIKREFVNEFKIIDDNIFILAEIMFTYKNNLTLDIERVIHRIKDRIYGEREYCKKNNGKKQLVFWHNDAMWDEEAKEYILMEPYYDRIDNMEFVKKKKKKIVLNPIQCGEETDKTVDYILDLSKRIINDNVEALNKYLDVRFKTKQWNILMLYTVFCIIYDIYIKYNKLLPYVNEDYYALGIEKIYVSDMDDMLMNSYLYAAYRWSIVSRFLGIKTKNISFFIESSLENDEKRIYDTNRIQSNRKNNKPTKIPTIECPYVSNEEIILGMTRFPIEIEEYCLQKAQGRIAKLDIEEFFKIETEVLKNTEKDIENRKLILGGNFKAKDLFEELAEKCFIELLPCKYFEAFPIFYKIAYDYSSTWKVRKIYDSMSSSIIMGIIECIHSVNEALICDIQHSGMYSFCKNHIKAEIYAYDRFCTWGWHSDVMPSKSKAVAMSRVPNCKVNNSFRTKNKILYFDFSILTGNLYYFVNWEEIVKEEIKFLDLLPEDIRRRLVIRTFSTKSRCDFQLRCQEKYPYIEFENISKSLSESIQESEMIITYPSSPMYEVFFFNKPFVCLDVTKNISPTPFFVKYKGELMRSGVYYENTEECAKAFYDYKSLLKQIESNYAKERVKDFVYKATNCDKDIKEEWYKEFIS